MSRQMFIISLHLVFSGGLVIAAVLPLQPASARDQRIFKGKRPQKRERLKSTPLPGIKNGLDTINGTQAEPGAENGVRTRDPRLGKPMLYH